MNWTLALPSISGAVLVQNLRASEIYGGVYRSDFGESGTTDVMVIEANGEMMMSSTQAASN